MEYENGQWIMKGISKDSPHRIKNINELIDYINKVGFLPLFSNDIKGFSLEEKTYAYDWFCENPQTDPWIWREELAKSGKVVYSKLFDKRAGFVSLEWFPHLVNWRRDGYDFDSLVDEGIAKRREALIMNLFLEDDSSKYSCDIKKQAGFSKGGEKNFNGVITDLMMKTYLVLSDFKQRKNKKGEPYGMKIAIYSTPESIWTYDEVTKAYTEDPEKSKELILNHLKTILPDAEEKQIIKLFL